MTQKQITSEFYGELQYVYDYFNAKLFGSNTMVSKSVSGLITTKSSQINLKALGLCQVILVYQMGREPVRKWLIIQSQTDCF